MQARCVSTVRTEMQPAGDVATAAAASGEERHLALSSSQWFHAGATGERWRAQPAGARRQLAAPLHRRGREPGIAALLVQLGQLSGRLRSEVEHVESLVIVD